jgi:hypothetical protein
VIVDGGLGVARKTSLCRCNEIVGEGVREFAGDDEVGVVDCFNEPGRERERSLRGVWEFPVNGDGGVMGGVGNSDKILKK